SQRVYVYDMDSVSPNGLYRYALYTWNDKDQPALLEAGYFSVSPDGAVVRSAESVVRYSSEVLSSVGAPPAVFDEHLAFASATDALMARLGVASSDIAQTRILLDPAGSGPLTVVLSSGGVDYHYSFDTVTGEVLLLRTRSAGSASGTYLWTSYDAEGRKISESLEAADGTVTDLFTYRYATAGELAVIDHSNRTVKVLRLNADGTTGETLRAGFYDDANRIYSLQGAGAAEANWYTYGADGVMLTSDDAPTSRPKRGYDRPSGGPGRRMPGGDNTSLEEKIRRLRAMMRDFQECSEENMRSDWKLAKKCEDMMGSIGGLQKDIENEQYRGMGLGGRGGEGGGDQDLNYHNPAATPAYVAPLEGVGSAPLANPAAVVVDNTDGTKTITLGGFVSVWKAGETGWGTGNDVLLETTETVTGTTWVYENGLVTRAVTRSGGAETLLARYTFDLAARTVTVSEADGSSCLYRFTDEKDPFGTGELIRAEVTRAGVVLVETYESGRLMSSCAAGGASCTNYAYDTLSNTVTLTASDGATRIVNMGFDGRLGTGDDYLVGGTDMLDVSMEDGRLLSVLDGVNNSFTQFFYEGNRVNIVTTLAGLEISNITVDLGADGVLGTADDRYVVVDAYMSVPVLDSDGRYLREDGTVSLSPAEAAVTVVHLVTLYDWQGVSSEAS
ncbi:MAG TPA: hypothetical protein PLY30_03035, partial [Candidatus Omnitrophota bacterium]|nr:hypothetical protein [Candidatus Omnitrophota bacterium]